MLVVKSPSKLLKHVNATWLGARHGLSLKLPYEHFVPVSSARRICLVASLAVF